ncbi:hypothetical protein [Bacillus phage SPbetaL1]|nr:hypothetical protein [Bacillus phage SPbetaL1]
MLYKSNIENENETNLPFLNSITVLSNMKKIVKYNNEKFPDMSDLKGDFFSAINNLQGTNIPSKNDCILIEFENNELCEHLKKSKLFDEKATSNNKHLFNEIEKNKIKYNITTALKIIHSLEPNLYYLINQLIGTIYCIKVKGSAGGSISNSIGLIWLNPSCDWSVIDYADAIYHEFIHNSLFLDDMVNCIFPDPQLCEKNDAFVLSPIRKERRPLDRSYHASCVAIGLMHFYHLLSDDKNARRFLEDLRQTVTELNTKTSYLGKRGIEILKAMNNFIEKQDYENISKTLKIS